MLWNENECGKTQGNENLKGTDYNRSETTGEWGNILTIWKA
jgi:hypothetical protein